MNLDRKFPDKKVAIITAFFARSVFGKVNSLQPQDSRQYLFCLTPKPEVKSNHKLMRGVTNIGKLGRGFNVTCIF